MSHHLSALAKVKIAAATFPIRVEPRVKGLCVAVPSGLLLSAGHCTKFNVQGGSALGDFFVSEIEIGKARVLAQPVAVEPVADIAVLAEIDNQSSPEEAEKYEDALQIVEPVKVALEIPPLGRPFPVWIRTHLKTWVAGDATYSASGQFWISSSLPIIGGTSGGPVVDQRGELVGIVSHTHEMPGAKECLTTAALAAAALPNWIIARLADAQS